MMHYEHIYLVVQINCGNKKLSCVCGSLRRQTLMCGDTLYNFKKYFYGDYVFIKFYYTCFIIYNTKVKKLKIMSLTGDLQD